MSISQIPHPSVIEDNRNFGDGSRPGEVDRRPTENRGTQGDQGDIADRPTRARRREYNGYDPSGPV